MSLVIIGVDPGSRYTGLVIRINDGLVNHSVLDAGQRRKRALPSMGYVWDVLDWIQAGVDHVRSFDHDVTVALEGLVPPSGYARGAAKGERSPLTDPGTHMGVAMVMSGVAVQFRDLVVEVRPGGHGEGPLRTYPPELVGPREKGVFGSGILGHARSAWDIAEAAHHSLRAPRLAWRTGDP